LKFSSCINTRKNLKLLAINALPACAIASSDIATLRHVTLDASMEVAARETKLFLIS
jgi:hypothetical protein